MAGEKGTVASGLEAEAAAARRRNVPSSSANGTTVSEVEVDDKKTQAKKVSISAINPEQLEQPAEFLGKMC